MINSYFDDLIDLIDDRDVRRNYISVLKLLYDTEFVFFIDEDINRLYDAKNLRTELGGPVVRSLSVLEVMIALAKRCHEDIMYGCVFDDQPSSIAYWFWVMMDNSGLSELEERQAIHTDIFKHKFDEIMNIVIHRKYDYYGNGGFFPLRHPEMDQRFCELWYQLNAYLLENYPF